MLLGEIYTSFHMVYVRFRGKGRVTEIATAVTGPWFAEHNDKPQVSFSSPLRNYHSNHHLTVSVSLCNFSKLGI